MGTRGGVVGVRGHHTYRILGHIKARDYNAVSHCPVCQSVTSYPPTQSESPGKDLPKEALE